MPHGRCDLPARIVGCIVRAAYCSLRAEPKPRPSGKEGGKEKEWIIFEPSEQFYKNAVNLAKGHENITVINDFFPSTKYNIDHIDLILCFSLLHEVEKPEELLAGMKKISDMNTTLHVNVPNANSIHRLLAKECNIIDSVYDMSERNIILQQNRVYDMASLVSQIENAGFEVIDKGSLFVKFLSSAQMLQLVRNKIIDRNVLDGLYRLIDYMPEYGSELYISFRRS